MGITEVQELGFRDLSSGMRVLGFRTVGLGDLGLPALGRAYRSGDLRFKVSRCWGSLLVGPFIGVGLFDSFRSHFLKSGSLVGRFGFGSLPLP